MLYDKNAASMAISWWSVPYDNILHIKEVAEGVSAYPTNSVQ